MFIRKMDLMTQVFLNKMGSKLILSFEYNPHINEQLKKIPGCRFNKQISRWEAPLGQYERITAELDNLKVSSAVAQWMSDEIQLRKKVEFLQSDAYYELTDYSPKLPLMSHQKKAFELHRICNGSANYGEMGCGKTASAICALHWYIETGKVKYCLVVCPKSVVKSWEEQIQMFSNLTYIALEGTMAERQKKLKLERDIYIVNYEGTWRMEEDLIKKGFNAMVCDEAHRIKNTQSSQSKSCYAIGDTTEYRIALTGSPVLNSPLDAYGLMRFIDASVFGESFYSFRNKYFLNVGNENSPIPIFVPRHNAEKEISDKMYSRAVRVLKDEVLDLPPAVHAPNRIVSLSEEQDKAYRDLQEKLCAEIAGNKQIKISHVLTLMLKLNQITSGWLKDPETGDIHYFKNNPKFDELVDIVEEAGNQSMIIWAYYKADMKLITNYFGRCQGRDGKCLEPVNLVKEKDCPKCRTPIRYRCSEIQGSTKYRYAEMAKFRFTPEERSEQRKKLITDGLGKQEIRSQLGDLLLDGSEPPQTNIINLQCVAGSEGIQLQKAQVAIWFSRNWSLKDWVQAQARNHRVGQTKSVTYINIVAQMRNGEDTVDQRIVNALQKKEDLSKRINKDDIKLLTGNFKKKDKEAFKDIEFIEDIADTGSEEKDSGSVEISNDPDYVEKSISNEINLSSTNTGDQPSLF